MFRSGLLSLVLAAGCGAVDGVRDPATLGDAASLDLAPTVTDVSISPAAFRSGDTLTCGYTFSDPEGAADQSQVAWMVNGVAVGTGPTLSSGFAGGDTVACQVTPADGTTTGTMVEATRTALRGAIRGQVFLDSNGDGMHDAVEVGIANRTVYLDDDDDNVLDPGEITAVTDAGGVYELPDVAPGTRNVALLDDAAWNQTYPTLGPRYADAFNDAIIDGAMWSASGNGVAEAGGILTVDRDGPTDAITFRPQLVTGSGRVTFSIRNTQIHWKDMFHGFQVMGPCDTVRNINGVSFGFSRYGNFFLAQSRCDGTSYSYPAAYAINTWYTFDAIIGNGKIRILVNGVERGMADVPVANLVFSLPGLYSDGGSETNSISQVDNFSFQFYDYTHSIPVEDGEVVSGIDFGTDG